MEWNIIWTIVLLAVLFGIVYLQEVNGKSRVRARLEEKGFGQITIRTRMFAGGRGSLSFDVEYCDEHGIMRQNSCMVQTSIFSDGKIYWEKPLMG